MSGPKGKAPKGFLIWKECIELLVSQAVHDFLNVLGGIRTPLLRRLRKHATRDIALKVGPADPRESTLNRHRHEDNNHRSLSLSAWYTERRLSSYRFRAHHAASAVQCVVLDLVRIQFQGDWCVSRCQQPSSTCA